MRASILRYLAVFSVAARHGGFKAAAVELNLSPAAVSNQVRELETQLGVALFTRSPRGVELTSEGRILQTHVAKGLNSIEKGVDELSGDSLRGRLVVNIAPSLAQLWLAPLLVEFRDRHPEIDLHVHANEEAPDLLRGEADIRIVHGIGEFPGLDSKLLMRETVTPVCSPALLKARPVEAFGDLLHHTLIHDKGLGPEETSLQWGRWFEDTDLMMPDESRNLYFGNAVLALDAAASGQGVALGRSVLTSAMLRSGKLVRPLERTKDAARGYYSVTTKTSANRPRVAAFREWLHGHSEPPRQSGSGSDF